MKILYGDTDTKDKDVLKVINRSILFMKRVYIKGKTDSVLSQKTVFETLSEVKNSIMNTPVNQENNIIPFKLKKRREKNKQKRKIKRLEKKKSSSDKNTAISTELTTTHQNEQPSTEQPSTKPLKTTIIPYKDIGRCSENTTIYLTTSSPIMPDTIAEQRETFEIECKCQNDTQLFTIIERMPNV